MESIKVSIKTPEARKILDELAEKNLIDIKSRSEYKKEFLELAKKLRMRNTHLSPQDIQKEVTAVRKKQ